MCGPQARTLFMNPFTFGQSGPRGGAAEGSCALSRGGGGLAVAAMAVAGTSLQAGAQAGVTVSLCAAGQGHVL